MTTTLPTIESHTTVGKLLELFSPAQTGPRNRGSTTAKGIDAVPYGRAAEEVEVPPEVRFGAARYFHVHAPEVGGRLGAIPLYLVERDPALAALLKRRPAPTGHGDELYLDRAPDPALMPETNLVTIIIGPDSEPPAGSGAPLIGWTWHPGEPLAPLASGAEPTRHTGVKVHNG